MWQLTLDAATPIAQCCTTGHTGEECYISVNSKQGLHESRIIVTCLSLHLSLQPSRIEEQTGLYLAPLSPLMEQCEALCAKLSEQTQNNSQLWQLSSWHAHLLKVKFGVQFCWLCVGRFYMETSSVCEAEQFECRNRLPPPPDMMTSAGILWDTFKLPVLLLDRTDAYNFINLGKLSNVSRNTINPIAAHHISHIITFNFGGIPKVYQSPRS